MRLFARRLGVGGLTLLVGALFGGCSLFYAPLATVEKVDLTRYAGVWYEIASYPNSFQKGCTGTTAEYTLLNNGRVKVENQCFIDSLDGTVNDIEGTARTVDASNAKLKVSFFWFFEGDYWILEVGDAEDYGYAVVGEPSRRFLWILSRTPQMDEAVYEDILSRLPDKLYDASRLKLTQQPVPAGESE